MVFTPVDPQGREPRRRRFRAIPIRLLLPNMITLLSLCAGLTAIRLALEGRIEWALGAIVFAAVLDGVDGEEPNVRITMTPASVEPVETTRTEGTH